MGLNTLDWQFSLIFSVVVSISALLNSYILISNAPHLRRLPPSSFLIYWLCAYDSLVVINDLMVSAANLIHGNTNHFPPDTCYLHGFLAMFGSLASLLLCLGLTLFRYLVIIKKTKIRRVWAYLYLVLISAVAALASAMPFILGSQTWTYEMRPSNVYCAVAWYRHDPRTSALVYSALTIVTLPLAFIGYVYYCIYREISFIFEATRNALSNNSGSVPVAAADASQSVTEPDRKLPKGSLAVPVPEVPCTRKVRTGSLKRGGAYSSTGAVKTSSRREKKTEEDLLQDALLKQSIMIVFGFAAGWAPYVAVGLVENISGQRATPEWDFVGVLCIVIYEAINPVVIFLFDRDIKENCVNFIQCQA
ncbi:hypothetical protein HDU77_003423 [Chytriomyces hyalinus]|nr:hypothetical protein HDU77_003423 [Chytriomyces hyalinus]